MLYTTASHQYVVGETIDLCVYRLLGSASSFVLARICTDIGKHWPYPRCCCSYVEKGIKQPTNNQQPKPKKK